MKNSQKISLFILRITLGSMYLWAGFSKIVNPTWSAEGYLRSAKIAPDFYMWLASPSVLPIVNIVNEWGLFLLGLSLMLGLGVRISSLLGIVLMILYYIPLGFPYPNPHALIIDEHIIYAAGLFLLYTMRAGRIWGFGSWSSKSSVLQGWFD